MNWFQRLFARSAATPEVSAPELAVHEATDTARAAIGTELVAVFTYGSLATGEYIAGYSNINLLFVTKRLDAEILKKLAPVVVKWNKFPSLKPLFLSLAELKAYSESFPMEFGDIAEFRRNIGGEDVFQKIEPSNARLAEELESEIKICLVKLRKKYLLSGADEAATREQMAESSKTLFPVLRAFIRLKKRKPPKQRVRLIEEACRSYRFNRRTLLQVHDLRYGRKNAERIETWPLFEKLIQELTLMAELAAKGNQGAPVSEERTQRRDRPERFERRDRGDRTERDSSAAMRGGGGDRNAKLGQVKQLIQEASQRKKWEPKEPERFQSDEFSRDLGLTLSARFGWDKAWQPERRAKGYVPVAAEPTVVEEPSYEEEFGETSQGEEPTVSSAASTEGEPEAVPASVSESESEPESETTYPSSKE
jgi:hypothetical protein